MGATLPGTHPTSVPIWAGQGTRAGLALSPTAAPPSTHHGDVFHFRLVLPGRRAELRGSLLPGGAGGGSSLLQSQVGIAEVALQGLEHLGQISQVPLLQKNTRPLPSWAPLSFLCHSHLSVSCVCPLSAFLPSGCFQHPPTPLHLPRPCSKAVSIWTLGHMGLSGTFELRYSWEMETRKEEKGAVWCLWSDTGDSHLLWGYASS